MSGSHGSRSTRPASTSARMSLSESSTGRGYRAGPAGSGRRSAPRGAATTYRWVMTEQSGGAVDPTRHEAVALWVAIASKILRRDISKEDNERLIQDTLKEMQSRVN